jgi:hypothetical protein
MRRISIVQIEVATNKRVCHGGASGRVEVKISGKNPRSAGFLIEDASESLIRVSTSSDEPSGPSTPAHCLPGTDPVAAATEIVRD